MANKKKKGSNTGKVLIQKEELETLHNNDIHRASVEELVDALKDKMDEIITDLEDKKQEIEDIKDEVAG